MAYRIFDTITEKFLIPFRLIPAEGLPPEKLAFSITIGIVAGMFPVIGATTILSIMLTVLFRQNLLVVQSVQWIVALAQILMIIPFMQIGAFILNQQELHINTEQINLAFKPGILSGLKTIGIFHLYAILTWIIFSIPTGALSYFAFKAVFQKKNQDIPFRKM